MSQVIVEAKIGKKSQQMGTLFGVPLVSTSYNVVLEKIVQEVREKAFNKPFFVITAYSEFFLEMRRNPRFAQAMKEAEMVVPDGVAIKAAMDYLELPQRGEMGNFFQGLAIGKKILEGKYHERVVGVKLMETLLKLAVQNKYRVFLLGGWNGVAQRLGEHWREKGLNVQWDEGFENIQNALTHTSVNKPVTEKINKFKPDLLYVSFGRFKQELWINRQKENLRAGVVMGVGSAFDELAGEGVWQKPAPEWVERRGLKWLWRVTQDPKHIRRAWNAFAVFGWTVWQEKRKKK